MHCTQFFLLWVGEKHFSRVGRNSSNLRPYNAFNVCGIFCSLKVCPMLCQISALWVIRKVDFFKVLETAQAIGFIMQSVSVAYFSRLMGSLIGV